MSFKCDKRLSKYNSKLKDIGPQGSIKPKSGNRECTNIPLQEWYTENFSLPFGILQCLIFYISSLSMLFFTFTIVKEKITLIHILNQSIKNGPAKIFFRVDLRPCE